MSEQQAVEVKFNNEQREEVKSGTGYIIIGVAVRVQDDQLKAEPMHGHTTSFMGGYVGGNLYVGSPTAEERERRKNEPVNVEPKQVIIELTDEQQAQIQGALNREANHAQLRRNENGTLTAEVFSSPGIGTSEKLNLRVT